MRAGIVTSKVRLYLEGQHGFECGAASELLETVCDGDAGCNIVRACFGLCEEAWSICLLSVCFSMARRGCGRLAGLT